MPAENAICKIEAFFAKIRKDSIQNGSLKYAVSNKQRISYYNYPYWIFLINIVCSIVHHFHEYLSVAISQLKIIR